VEDLRVSGRVRWDRTTGAASANLRLSGATSGRLNIAWNDSDRHATAGVRGRVDGVRVDVAIDAP
jgi:hypothetical protein